MSSSFYAYLTRLRYIQRWGLKRNSVHENVMEHSWEVAVIAHLLATLRNTRFGGQLDADAIAVKALLHDASEVYTGDMPSPVKYHSPAITAAYKAIEAQAQQDLYRMLPADLQAAYQPVVVEQEWDNDSHQLIKAADIISAVLKCRAELQAGNQEFSMAAKEVEQRLHALNLPEVKCFMEIFAPAMALTLDEMLPYNN